MPAIALELNGIFLESRGCGAFVIDPDMSPVCLRFAYVTLGSEELIFPEVVFDDWGNELRRAALYQWIEENGDLFPRAELFGFNLQDESSQWFLREIDLQSRLRCYGYPDVNTSLSEGLEISHFVLCQEAALSPSQIQPRGDMQWPFPNLAVTWWQVEPSQAVEFARQLLNTSPSEGLGHPGPSQAD